MGLSHGQHRLVGFLRILHRGGACDDFDARMFGVNSGNESLGAAIMVVLARVF